MKHAEMKRELYFPFLGSGLGAACHQAEDQTRTPRVAGLGARGARPPAISAQRWLVLCQPEASRVQNGAGNQGFFPAGGIC